MAITKKEFADVNNSVVSMMKAYRNAVDNMRNVLLATYNFNKSILIDALVIDIDDISKIHGKESLSDDDIKEISLYKDFLISHIIDDDNKRKISEMEDKEVLDTMYEIKVKILDILSTNEELVKYTKEYKENLEELSKSKYEKWQIYYRTLKEKYEEEDDEEKKKELKKEIDEFKYINNYKFINELIYPDVETMVKSFFDEDKNSYIITKCFNKIKSFGLSKGMFSSLINIEEEFLPEYEEFNNLFLFLFTNYIAYANDTIKSTKKKVVKIGNDLLKLKGNSFYENEEKDILINAIKEILDKFKDYSDYFKENNQSYKNSEDREKIARKKKDYLVNQMIEMGIPGYEEYLDDIEKLDKYYSDKLHELEKDQILKYRDMNKNNIEEDDSEDKDTDISEEDAVDGVNRE